MMNAASPYRTTLMTLAPLFILAFYSLNTDLIIQQTVYSSTILKIIPILCAFIIYYLNNSINDKHNNSPSFGPMITWMLGLFIISLVRMLIGFDAEYAMIGMRYLLLTFLMITTWLITMRILTNQEISTQATLILLAIFAVACGSVVLDPYIDLRARIDPSMIGTYELSRAGGVFLQPNLASASLALLYALILPRVGPKMAIICTAAVLLAILLTFSRSGQIVVGLIIAISLMRGYLPRAAIWLLAGGVGLLLTGSYFQDQIIDTFGIGQGSGFMRLTDTDRFYGIDAFASDSRASLAGSAFVDFTDAPWVGRGLGFSWQWADLQSDGAGTHNIYLRYMLEYGVLGSLIWPLFLLAAYRIRNRALDSVWAAGICGAVMVAGLFSHNLPEQGSIVVVTLAILTLPVPQRGTQSIAEVRAA